MHSFDEVKKLPEVEFLGGWHDTSVVQLHEVVKIKTKVRSAARPCRCESSHSVGRRAGLPGV